MTREEAIKAIDANWPTENYTMLREALTLAKAALSSAPPDLVSDLEREIAALLHRMGSGTPDASSDAVLMQAAAATLTAAVTQRDAAERERDHERHEKETVADASQALVRHLRAERDTLTAALATATTYIELLESCQDGYYRASESPEAIAWELVKPGA